MCRTKLTKRQKLKNQTISDTRTKRGANNYNCVRQIWYFVSNVEFLC